MGRPGYLCYIGHVGAFTCTVFSTHLREGDSVLIKDYPCFIVNLTVCSVSRTTESVLRGEVFLVQIVLYKGSPVGQELVLYL